MRNLSVLLLVVIIYFALYLASLVILKPIIGYWSNATAVAFRPIFNSAMLIIYLTSPFNAYEALILHYPPWLYFIYTVVVPAVVLALNPSDCTKIVPSRHGGLRDCGWVVSDPLLRPSPRHVIHYVTRYLVHVG